jgi:hypothetical protein
MGKPPHIGNWMNKTASSYPENEIRANRVMKGILAENGIRIGEDLAAGYPWIRAGKQRVQIQRLCPW